MGWEDWGWGMGWGWVETGMGEGWVVGVRVRELGDWGVETGKAGGQREGELGVGVRVEVVVWNRLWLQRGATPSAEQFCCRLLRAGLGCPLSWLAC